MLPLPWWILGVTPDEETHADSDCETVDRASSVQLEVRESVPTTPVSMFRTPSASPFVDVPDQLPKVVDLSTFMHGAKRRSSTTLESQKPKMRKTEKRHSLERNETAVMNKSADGQSMADCEETFRILFDSQSPQRTESPIPFNDVFNETFHLDENGNEQISEQSNSSESESPNSREFPLFFTSFDDTTVLFNTTIAGDIDVSQKNDAVGDWVFKTNKFLEDNKPPADPDAAGDAVFKEPIQTKKARGRRSAASSVRSDRSLSSRRTPANKEKKKEVEEKPQEVESDPPFTPPKATVPSMTRRQTPSRKAKTYKNLKV